MSRAKTSLAALAFALAGVSACATAPDPDAEANAQLQAAMEEALKPATPEEIEAANNADPLTKANFWAKEYSKNAENLDNALTFADALRLLLIDSPGQPHWCVEKRYGGILNRDLC